MSNELHSVVSAAVGSSGDEPAGPASGAPLAKSPPALSRNRVAGLALVFAASLVACLLAYLAAAVPGAWFPSSRPATFGVRDLAVSRGTGVAKDNELRVSEPDVSGLAIVSLSVPLRSADYAAIAWLGMDVPEPAQATLLWQSDYMPGTIHTAPVRVEAGRTMPVGLSGNPKWIGNVRIALAVRGTFARPLVVRGVDAKPMGAREILFDRVREWLAFEPWTGSSINTVVGGADVQALPLPFLLAATVALAVLAVAIANRVRPRAARSSVAISLAALFLAAWALLDVRWTANLARQVDATRDRYGGKSWEEKRLANEDGPLFGFIEQARAIMPASPVRVFVVADEHYFRGRAAYHLYPHSPWFDARRNAMPPAAAMKPGDWLLVWQRRGVQYDPAQKRIRWDGGESIAAEMKLATTGSALFEIR